MARVSGQTLLLSHSLVFVTGFAVGKFVDYEELSSYRDQHESTMARFRRRAGNICIGVLTLGAIAFVMRTTASSPKITK